MGLKSVSLLFFSILFILLSCAESSQSTPVEKMLLDKSPKSEIAVGKPRSPLRIDVHKELRVDGLALKVTVGYTHPAEIVRVTIVDAAEKIDLVKPQLFTNLAAKQPVHADFLVKTSDEKIKVSCFVKSALGEKSYIKTIRVREAPAPLQATEDAESDVIYKQSGGQRLKLAPASAP